MRHRNWIYDLEYVIAVLASLLIAWLLSQSLETTLWGGLAGGQLLR
jgi:hypothetical protein